ncbi:oligosaccharide flippase family protein, partial [bacterium]|nr:oligosaccharide flippase family protein [bacterium]
MLGKKIAYNTAIAIIARAIGLALALIILGFITRYLGAFGFGEYTTILAFLYIFSVLSDFGLYSICVREISVPLTDEKKVVSNIFTIKFFAGLFCFTVGAFIGLFFPYSLNVKIGILIGAVGFWFLSNAQVLTGIFQKYLR